MSYRFQGALQDLAEQGATVDKMTADEIEALVFACARADNPYTDINAELCEQPVKVCKGLYLWPLTAGATIWLAEYAESWWKEGTPMYRWAQIYALMNARNPDAFAGLTVRWKARAAILKCMLRVCAHRKELAVAINRCYGIHEHDVEDPHKVEVPDNQQADNFAHFVACLEVQSGIPSKVWLWGKSLRLTAQTYHKMTDLNNALSGGKGAENMTFELNDALKNLANVKTMIVERIQHEQNH